VITDTGYLLPLCRHERPVERETIEYLRWLCNTVAEVVVVDGSPAHIFALHRQLLPAGVSHVAPAASETGLNGKAAGVRTGMRLLRTDFAIIGDDDVRYDAASLAAVRAALADADVVRPQNYFVPRPWHALLDEGRSLIARATGGDWPGTLGVRLETYRGCGGYDADVLFENFELVRTIRAAGGREVCAADVFVARRPPTFQHYAGQRVRQAYDEFARPRRLAFQLAFAPAIVALICRSGAYGAVGGWLAAMAVAEYGRRRRNGTLAFRFDATLFAPLWVLERAVTSWCAVVLRLRGGVRYSRGRIRKAANRDISHRTACPVGTEPRPTYLRLPGFSEDITQSEVGLDGLPRRATASRVR